MEARQAGTQLPSRSVGVCNESFSSVCLSMTRSTIISPVCSLPSLVFQVGHDDMQDEAAQGVDALFYVEPVPAEGGAALAAAPLQQTGGGPVGLETSGSSREDDDDMEIDALQGCDALAY